MRPVASNSLGGGRGDLDQNIDGPRGLARRSTTLDRSSVAISSTSLATTNELDAIGATGSLSARSKSITTSTNGFAVRRRDHQCTGDLAVRSHFFSFENDQYLPHWRALDRVGTGIHPSIALRPGVALPVGWKRKLFGDPAEVGE